VAVLLLADKDTANLVAEAMNKHRDIFSQETLCLGMPVPMAELLDHMDKNTTEAYSEQ
jgi:hypothetical protein